MKKGTIAGLIFFIVCFTMLANPSAIAEEPATGTISGTVYQEGSRYYYH